MRPDRRVAARLGGRQLSFQHLRLAFQVGAEHPWTEPGEEQNQAEVAEPIRDGVGERGVRGEDRLRFLGNRQLGDRAQAGPERGRLRHRARQDADRKPFVEPEDRADGDHGRETCHRDDQGQHDLRQRLFLQAAEKLRAHRVADREQEQVEERPAEQLRQFRPGQNPDRDAGNQGSDDGSESNPFEMEPADDRSEQDGEEQAQHGLVVQEERQGFDHWGICSRLWPGESHAPCQ